MQKIIKNDAGGQSSAVYTFYNTENSRDVSSGHQLNRVAGDYLLGEGQLDQYSYFYL